MLFTIYYYIKNYTIALLMWMLMYICRLFFPINNNKIVATAVRGKKYADNPRFIMEELLRRNRGLDLVWLSRGGFDLDIPKGIRSVRNNRNYLELAYEYSTAKVIIDSAHVSIWFRKRKGQTFINTWHGGLGIKKIEYDSNNFQVNKIYTAEIDVTVNSADVFISNSLHLSKLYRSAFRYKGPIFNCGYPKNDELFGNKTGSRVALRRKLNLPESINIVTYAPTFRAYFNNHGRWNIDMTVYDLDYERLIKTLENRFGGKCVVLVKMHPNNQNVIDLSNIVNDRIIDVTNYNNMQEIIMASDFFVSDYSSCIFDAAMIGIPCFTYATDFERYESDERGVYYRMEELPFPYSRNNDEMEQKILTFDEQNYLSRWEDFKNRVGLNETGHAAKDIADKICDVVDGRNVQWNNSKI